MTTTARAVVVIDYQNVHLTGHAHFRPTQPVHESLIIPGLFARRLIDVRNATSYIRVVAGIVATIVINAVRRIRRLITTGILLAIAGGSATSITTLHDLLVAH
ncbi:hypothetical protein [Mycobacterium hubeiense]|uniref:hypothetical protein n=1 Tax=Mycobacterium hubeiense TaxID=1867256 RepID=UPI0011597EEC|nr:hypothetical protein [Mycobacterium sp. QGD 101]